MSYGRHAQRGGASHLRLRRRRRPFGRTLFWAAALCLGAMTGFKVLDHVTPHDPNVRVAGNDAKPAIPVSMPPRAERPVAGVTPQTYSGLLAPGLSGSTPSSLAQSRPVGSAMRLASVPEALDLPDSEPILPLPAQAPVSLAERGAAQPASRPSDLIASLPPAQDIAGRPGLAPMPVPRPAGLAMPPATAEAEAETEPQRPAQQQPAAAAPSRRGRVAAAAPAPTPQDNRNFFEKLFGVQKQPQPAGTALAYAAPQDDVVDRGRVARMSPSAGTPPRTAEAGTAIYDISAKMVYLPNGERLEAHSGLGEYLDDPRYAHVRMKGVTPPHTYTLTERESLFHGVRAIRLNPVGGSGAIHGRAGLLAHTFMLGPRGDSNGCISFRDYERFLQAYLRGEVKRLVVVASL